MDASGVRRSWLSEESRAERMDSASATTRTVSTSRFRCIRSTATAENPRQAVELAPEAGAAQHGGIGGFHNQNADDAVARAQGLEQASGVAVNRGAAAGRLAVTANPGGDAPGIVVQGAALGPGGAEFLGFLDRPRGARVGLRHHPARQQDHDVDVQQVPQLRRDG